MKKSLSVSLLIIFTLSTIAIYAQDLRAGQGRPEPPMAGVHWAKGQAKPGGGSPNLIYHGGPVQHGTVVEPIFWGDWSNPGDKITGIQSFYVGVGGSNYAGTNTEFFDGVGNVSSAVTLGATHIDPSPAPKMGNKTSTILAEVCSMIANPKSDGYYPVYIDAPRGHAGFCAWHSAGTCGNVTVQFAFFFKLDGDPGCDPEDNLTTHSQGLAALGNVSGHELSEMLTDPHLNAWYDSSGAENSDKCAWSFGANALRFSNRSLWKIQGNWSNAAFDGNFGFPNLGGQNGCIDGTN